MRKWDWRIFCIALFTFGIIAFIQQYRSILKLEEELWTLSRQAVVCASLRSNFFGALRHELIAIERQQTLIAMSMFVNEWSPEESIILDLKRRNEDNIREQDNRTRYSSLLHNEECMEISPDSLPKID